MITITITWHLILTIIINLAIIIAVVNWAGGESWGCALGGLFLFFVTIIIWSIYGGIVWW